MTRAEGAGEQVEEEVGVTGENETVGEMECLVRSVSVTPGEVERLKTLRG